MITRRSFLKSSGALVAAGSVRVRAAQAQHIVVVGAGVFGGWTALSLLRKGARVTLVDAWGPGHARASSGGETRVIRASYGGQKMYVELVARALELWRDNEKRWNKKLLFQCGSLRLRKDASYAKSAVPLLEGAGLKIEELTPSEAGKRFPQINMDGVGWALYEHDAGYLLARRACQAVLESFIAEGGTYRQLAVKSTDLEVGLPEGLFLSDGTYQLADQYVFACGPWLGKLFPETIGDRIRPNRQEVFFFGTAAGDARFGESQMPCFLDGAVSPSYYGIPGNEWRGFKVAGGTPNAPTFDPTDGDRSVTSDLVAAARGYMELRFPALKGAPLVGSKVCQYESSLDGDFIVDQHPKADHVWILGGGSGHGFKHGPAFGERVASQVLGERNKDALFSLSRFA
jgi:glycine/D-amino acid oxidase-like deaminating enzyme